MSRATDASPANNVDPTGRPLLPNRNVKHSPSQMMRTAHRFPRHVRRVKMLQPYHVVKEFVRHHFLAAVVGRPRREK